MEGIRTFNINYPSGTFDSSTAHILSCEFIFCVADRYLLSLNIRSAFSLLNEQHMPLSVACIVKIAAQLIGLPLHKHFLIIPESS